MTERPADLFRKIQSRLGEDCFEGHDVSFGYLPGHDWPLVGIDGLAYVRLPNGTITASREIGGRFEVFVLTEDGRMEFVSASSAAPEGAN